MDKIAFIHFDLLVGDHTSIYRPASLAEHVSDVLTSLSRMRYEAFFLADVEPYAQAPVREWLLHHGLVRAPFADRYEGDPGTLERILFRPLYTPSENRHFWRVMTIQTIAFAYQAQHVLVLEVPDTSVLKKLRDTNGSPPFELECYDALSAFLLQHPLEQTTRTVPELYRRGEIRKR